eukprot:642329-Ditylum_brightwellii.AAC.1
MGMQLLLNNLGFLYPAGPMDTSAARDIYPVQKLPSLSCCNLKLFLKGDGSTFLVWSCWCVFPSKPRKEEMTRARQDF